MYYAYVANSPRLKYQGDGAWDGCDSHGSEDRILAGSRIPLLPFIVVEAGAAAIPRLNDDGSNFKTQGESDELWGSPGIARQNQSLNKLGIRVSSQVPQTRHFPFNLMGNARVRKLRCHANGILDRIGIGAPVADNRAALYAQQRRATIL